MQSLSTTLRNQLERTVVAARDVAETGAWAALQRLAVHKAPAPNHLSSELRKLRNKLRARGRQLGDVRQENGQQGIFHLHRECAYECWHQMLFARFLAENQLLMHPDGVAVSLEECEELAADEGTDGWTLAARYASRMLPQIFRPDDPLLAVTFAPEDKQALEKLLADLPSQVFTADDSLGWVYQFWQSKEKNRVNASGDKIGADELPAVTQLFTEDYMVKFLLHNTLGAWWAGKRLRDEGGGMKDEWEECQTEADCRRLLSLPGIDWEYLRFVQVEQRPESETSAFRLPPSAFFPAAGTFDGWPQRAADIKIMDPCCGSGHFLVAAFEIMVRLRMEEEGLSATDACDAVLQDNIHGLEIDQRCTQIAAFAVGLAAWTLSDAGGYRKLPRLQIACTGVAPQATKKEWIRLAEESGIPIPTGSREPIRNGLINLHCLFSQAPALGSLIEPNSLPEDLISADYNAILPYLDAVSGAENTDDEYHERAVAVAGIVRAASLLAEHYALVVTNVPYLGHDKKGTVLKRYCERVYSDAKADLATCLLERSLRFTTRCGTAALVTPQSWLYQDSFKRLRPRILRKASLDLLVRLGPSAFEAISGEVVNVCLISISNTEPNRGQTFMGLDVSALRFPAAKDASLQTQETAVAHQASVSQNPQAKISLEAIGGRQLLSKYATSHLGICTGDYSRFGRFFWEIKSFDDTWAPQQSTVEATRFYGGMSKVLRWDGGSGELLSFLEQRLGENGLYQWLRGEEAWGKNGVVVSATGSLWASLYRGNLFDNNVTVIVPNDPSHLPALWAFCETREFHDSVRRINQALKITDQSMIEVPFDLLRSQQVAEEKYPNGLPEPESNDPTQWIFHGWPDNTTGPMHVALARLLGYRWPAELDPEMRLSNRARELVASCADLLQYADQDGIACIPSVSGEEPAATRLTELLAACGIQPPPDLDAWLRDKFFEQHCQLFHQRPFIWHIWDGRRKDGFHALVNYHKLDRKLLEKLIYTYLGDWITRQKSAENRNESGAEARRLAAEDLQRRLKLILEGEPPYDIFVRWKPLAEQPIGWEPDLNDGVRLNIRPFVNAGVLRRNAKIKWKKDRGKEPERPRDQYPWFWSWDESTEDFPGGPAFDGNRWNDCHYSNKMKQAARDAAKPQEAIG